MSAHIAVPSDGHGRVACYGSMRMHRLGWIALLVACEQGQPPPREALQPAMSPHRVDAAPAMSPPRDAKPGCTGDCLPAVSYVDTIGTSYTPASLAGKVVVVNFWATWCAPCKKELPELSKLYDAYKAKGVVFLGVLLDNPDNAQLLNFQSDFEMSFPVVRSTPEIMVAYSYPDRLPTTFVFDRGGHKAMSRIGAVPEAELTELLDRLTTP